MDGVLRDAAENVQTIASAEEMLRAAANEEARAAGDAVPDEQPLPSGANLCDLIKALDTGALQRALAIINPPSTAARAT